MAKAKAVVLTAEDWEWLAAGLSSTVGFHPYGTTAKIFIKIGPQGKIAAANGVAPAKVRKRK